MKIMHVITGLGVGGAEIALCNLSENLNALGAQQIVVSLSSEGLLSKRVREAVARLEHLDMKPGRPHPAALRNLTKLIAFEKPDLVHSWMYHANLAASLACLVGKVPPVIWAVHASVDSLRREKRATRCLIWLGARLSWQPQRIVYVSRLAARQHRNLGYRKTGERVIPNGFDTDKLCPSRLQREKTRAELRVSDQDFVIGLIARYHPMKDHKNFMRAAACFAADRPNAAFVLAGNGLDMENDEVVNGLKSLDLMDRTRLCGRCSNVSDLIAGLDALCLSSAWGEAFPMIIGEAMACGVPCVATDVGDVREFIGDTGIVVPPMDAAALCAGWKIIANLSAEQREALGRRARDRIVRNYSSRLMASTYRNLYEETIRANRPGKLRTK